MHLVDGGAHPQGECGDAGHRHHHHEHRVQKAAVEDGVLEQLDVVGQAGEALDAAQSVVGKAVIHTDEHGDDHEGHKEDQAGQQEQVGRGGLPPHQRAAHTGGSAFLDFFRLLSGSRSRSVLSHKISPSLTRICLPSPGEDGRYTVPAPSHSGSGHRIAWNRIRASAGGQPMLAFA